MTISHSGLLFFGPPCITGPVSSMLRMHNY